MRIYLGNGITFSCVRDIVDDNALRDKSVNLLKKLMNKYLGKLILKLPGLPQNFGVQSIEKIFKKI